MSADPLVEDATAVVRWIETASIPRFTARECFCKFQGRFKKMENLVPVLALLVGHGYVCKRPPSVGAGRPSEAYDVNPALRPKVRMAA
jgi:hypothetical protein